MANVVDAVAAGVWSASWHGAVAAAVVLLVRGVAGRRLSPGWRCALWGLVAVRLLMPVAPAAPVSVFGAVDGWSRRTALPPPDAGEARVTVTYGGVAEFPAVTAGPAAFAERASASSVPHRLSLLWAVGALAVLLRTGVGWARLRRVIARADDVTDPAALAALAECAARLGVVRPVRLVCSGSVSGPAMAGVWRPVILVPPGLVDELSPRELRFVFLHELAHVKRWDAAAEWLIALLAAVHWFNPLAWLAARSYRADRELARDAMVLRAVSGDPASDARQGYGATLLRLAEVVAHGPPAAGMVGLVWPGGRLRERVRRIAAFTPARRPGSVLLGIAAVALVGCSTLTDGKKKQPATTTATESNTPIVMPTIDDGPADEVITRVYDVRDLATDVPDFESRQAFPDRSGAGTTRPAPRRPLSREEQTAHLATLVRETVDPMTWQWPGAAAQDAAYTTAGVQPRQRVGVIRELNGQLVVTHRRENHRSLVALLGQLRETRAIQIQIEARFISLDKADVERLPEEIRKQMAGVGEPQPAGRRDRGGNFLDDAQVAALTKALTAHAATTTLAAPRVMLFNGQKAYVMVGTQTAYVADLKAVRSKTDPTAVSYEPDVQVVDDGLIVDFQATISADREFVTMTLNPRLNRLLRIETVPFEKAPPDARGERPTVQRPIVSSTEVATTVSVPNGRTVLLLSNGPLPRGAQGLKGPEAPGAEPSDRLLLMLAKPRILVHGAAWPTTRPQ